MSCCNPNNFDQVFDTKLAKKELRQFRKRGPKKTTRHLIDLIEEAAPVASKSLLDIGGGVGSIPLTLADKGIRETTNVDASQSYQSVMSEEASARGLSDSFEFVAGDFVDVSDKVNNADIVTLDRVICCYEDMPSLVKSSVEKAREVYAVVYPRSVWWNRILVGLANVSLKVFRKQFKTYVHDTLSVEQLVFASGFEKTGYRKTPIWQIAVFKKKG